MVTGKDDLIPAMIEAYMMEKGINQFYTELSVKAHSYEARKAFSELARWEAEHMRYMQHLYQAFTDEREMLSFNEFATRAKPDTAEGGMPMKELEESIEEYAFLDDIGAIMFALKVEGNEYNLYKKLSSQAQDTNAKVLFEELMGWEQKHIEYLMGLKQKIEGSLRRA
ncbi:MAG: hypothetical protein M1510_06690 [Nitrospirae bacterium]|nr:hypothetical protein [Nitrospirota bacterium]MCL5236351.1 hypothetical protein [Nitrospirota bacterium]